MRKWSRVVVAILMVAVAATITWAAVENRPPPEALYQGKPISYWLQYQNPNVIHAMCSLMGTNALPTLVRLLDAQDGPTQRAYRAVWSRIPLGLRLRLPKPIDSNHVRYQALFALQQIKPIPEAAVPKVIRIMTTDKDMAFRISAAGVLRFSGPTNEVVTRALVSALSDTNEAVRTDVAYIWDVKRDPTIAVPAFIKLLHDRSPEVRALAAMTLGRYGASARLALPELLRLRDDFEPSPRDSALKAIQAIESSTATMPASGDEILHSLLQPK